MIAKCTLLRPTQPLCARVAEWVQLGSCTLTVLGCGAYASPPVRHTPVKKAQIEATKDWKEVGGTLAQQRIERLNESLLQMAKEKAELEAEKEGAVRKLQSEKDDLARRVGLLEDLARQGLSFRPVA